MLTNRIGTASAAPVGTRHTKPTRDERFSSPATVFFEDDVRRDKVLAMRAGVVFLHSQNVQRRTHEPA